MVLLFMSKTTLFPSQKSKKVVAYIRGADVVSTAIPGGAAAWNNELCVVNAPACRNHDKYVLNPMYYKPTLKGLVLYLTVHRLM